MNRKRLPGIGHWPAMIVAASAITLALGGVAQTSASASSGASPSPSPSASPSPSVSPSPTASPSAKPLKAGRPGGTCSVTRSGRIADCQPPVAKSKLPPGARNTGTLGQPVTDLADLVDARTWTTGGGNTFPGADAPFGMVQWSPDTLPDRNDGGGYGYGDTSLTASP